MDAPVLGPTAELRGFVDEDDGRVCFWDEGEEEEERGPSHDGRDVTGPAPA